MGRSSLPRESLDIWLQRDKAFALRSCNQDQLRSCNQDHLRCLLPIADNRIMPNAAVKTFIATADAPAAIGPYSQAIRTGDVVYTSGQVALDPATGNLVSGGISEQTTRVLENLKAVLAAADLDLTHVVKTTVFLKNMADFAVMNGIYATYFAPEGTVAPARSTVQVAGLPKDALVEIECIAKAP
jgi:2-iminobutanoate/2-iminopropanoate deaminase